MFVPATPADRLGFDVCVVGSANLDLVVTTLRIPGPGETVLGSNYAEHAGGKGLNQAVAAARSGARTTFVGAIGNDDAGVQLAGVLTTDQIDATYLRTFERTTNVATGRALIVVDDHGENTIVVVPGANARVSSPAPFPSARIVLAQLEIPVESVGDAFNAARALGATTILNPAPAAELPTSLLLLCDIVVPNEHELELLGGSTALLDGGCGVVVVTRGAGGVDLVTHADVVHLEAFNVDPVDTTGAGDAFCGSLAARLAAGDELVDAVRWATAAGALATTVAGAVPAQPTASAIRDLLSRH